MFYRKRTLFLATLSMFFVLILTTACQKDSDYNIDNNTNFSDQSMQDEPSENDDQLIGGDKDEHGCLTAAGYSWCEDKEKCLRTWEEECEFSPAKKATEEPIVFEDLEWKKYNNKILGYSIDYPTIVNIMGNNLDQRVEFTGPLSNNEWWPNISISHYSNDFYRPADDVDVVDWVKPFPEYRIGEDISIAGLKTVHYVQDKTPQAWAADYYYFINDNQLYNIIITHTNDKQDWQLYNRILDSFSFGDNMTIE